jgi:hypothetical protein
LLVRLCTSQLPVSATHGGNWKGERSSGRPADTSTATNRQLER